MASGPTLDPEAASAFADESLTSAEMLIESGESLQEAEKARGTEYALLEEALSALDEDDEANTGHLEDMAAQQGRDAVRHEGKAHAMASAAGMTSDQWPPLDGAKELARLAQEAIRAASDRIDQLTESDDRERLLARLARVDDRRQRLSSLLSQGR